MIQMKSGAYGTKHGMKRASDGPFSLSPEEEARLVSRGVAKYVGAPVEAPADKEEQPLEKLSLAELRAKCKEYGISYRVGMTKAVMADAIRVKLAQAAPGEAESDDADEDPDNTVDETEDAPDEEPAEEEHPEEDAPTFDPAEAVQ